MWNIMMYVGMCNHDESVMMMTRDWRGGYNPIARAVVERKTPTTAAAAIVPTNTLRPPTNLKEKCVPPKRDEAAPDVGSVGSVGSDVETVGVVGSGATLGAVGSTAGGGGGGVGVVGPVGTTNKPPPTSLASMPKLNVAA